MNDNNDLDKFTSFFLVINMTQVNKTLSLHLWDLSPLVLSIQIPVFIYFTDISGHSSRKSSVYPWLKSRDDSSLKPREYSLLKSRVYSSLKSRDDFSLKSEVYSSLKLTGDSSVKTRVHFSVMSVVKYIQKPMF